MFSKSKNLLSCTLLGVLLSVSVQVGATVLTFEDLGNTGSDPLLDGYGGFDWNNETQVYVLSKNFQLGTGYEHGAVSGSNVVYNGYGWTPTYIDWVGSGTFDFNGAYWTSAWSDQNLTFAGYKGGNQVYTSNTYAINTQQPLWIGLNWTGIDRLVIHNTGSQWAMDNFTFNQASSVPEPTTMALLGMGLAGLGAVRRRRKA